MTEVTFHKKSFLDTFEALRKQFNATPDIVIETDVSGSRFTLRAMGGTDQIVQAFGPCESIGPAISVQCNMTDLEQAIIDAHSDSDVEMVTLIVGDGVWVKDPEPSEVEAD
jgi:hypothetical protein